MSWKNPYFSILNLKVVLEKVIILVRVPSETGSETVDYLGCDIRKHLEKIGGTSQGMKGSQ